MSRFEPAVHAKKGKKDDNWAVNLMNRELSPGNRSVSQKWDHFLHMNI